MQVLGLRISICEFREDTLQLITSLVPVPLPPLLPSPSLGHHHLLLGLITLSVEVQCPMVSRSSLSSSQSLFLLGAAEESFSGLQSPEGAGGQAVMRDCPLQSCGALFRDFLGYLLLLVLEPGSHTWYGHPGENTWDGCCVMGFQINPEYFLEGLMLKLQYFGHVM